MAMMESLQVLNSVVRTALALILVGSVGTAGWYGYQTYTESDKQLENVQRSLAEREAALADSHQRLDSARRQLEDQQLQLASKDAEIAERLVEIEHLNEDIRQKLEEIQRLDTALRLHKMERRLARVSVLEVEKDAESGKTFSTIGFVELNDTGDPIGEMRTFQLEGDVVYVDYRVVKFDDRYVEQADLERGTTICLFNRIFGEFQKPRDGFTLDEPGTRPGAYERGGVISDFERKIWEDFWYIANDPRRAEQLGIRALHGDAVSIKVQQGKTYRITVRASGGPEIQIEEDPPADGAAVISRDFRTQRRG
jgi:hypothetical protein